MSFVGPRALRPGEIETTGNGQHVAMEDDSRLRRTARRPPGAHRHRPDLRAARCARRYKFKYDRIYVQQPELLASTCA